MDDASISREARRRGRGAVLSAIACTTLLAACGSSGKPGVSVQAGRHLPLELAQCMRSHGVPSFPDPSANGTISFGPGSGVDPRSPAFQSAQHACASLSPKGGGPPHVSESQKLAEIAFAKCMRAHGQPNFPDPTLTAPSGSGPILSLRGMLFAIGPGIDPGSPAFRRSAAACGLKPPSGAPHGG